MIAATVVCVVKLGPRVYYLTFHRPFQLTVFATDQPHYASSLPGFQVRATIGQTAAKTGDTQNIGVTVLPHQTTKGFLEVWITSPAHREVFKSILAKNSPELFTAGQKKTYTYNFKLTASLPRGVYTVSELITSVDQKTDYQLNENFASFTLE